MWLPDKEAAQRAGQLGRLSNKPQAIKTNCRPLGNCQW